MSEVAIKIMDAYCRVKRKEQSERELWDKCFQYVNNRVDGQLGQWSTLLRNELKPSGKPTISFNEIKKFVNRICGAQSQTKVEEKAFPRDDTADPLTAEAITDCLKYVYYINNYEMKVRRMFRNGVICSVGYMKVEWSDELDPMGEISIKVLNSKNVYVAGLEGYDLRDSEGVFEVIPMTKDEMYSQFPDAKSEIDGLVRNTIDSKDIPVASDLDYSFGKSIPLGDVYDSDEKKFNVLRCQKYEYKTVSFIQNLQNGDLTEADLSPKEVRAALELIQQQTGIQHKIIKKRLRKIKVMTCVGDVLLEDRWSTYKHNRPDIIQFVCYLDDNKETGVVQDLLDPQDEKNKRHSQIIHILGTSARNSYWARKGALDDVEDARKRLSRTGEIIEANGDLNQVMKPIESNLTAVPAIIQMDVAATSEMKEISGLHDAAMGQVPTGVKSGRGIQELQQPTEVIIGEIYDNLIITRRSIAETVVSLIQQYYTDERRIRILGEYHPAIMDERMEKMKSLGIANVENGAMTLMLNKQIGDTKYNDVTVGRYDIAIETVSYNPTERRAKYFEMLNMKGMGAPIKWSTIIRNSDAPGKQEMLRDVLEAEAYMSGMMNGAPPQAGSAPQASLPGGIPQDLGLNLAGVQS